MKSSVNIFPRWLERALQGRGWSQAEFARRSQLSSSYVSRLLNGARRPKLEACTKIAKALHLSPEAVLSQAGLLQGTPPDLPDVDELCTIARQLPEPDRRDLLVLARDRLMRQQERQRTP